MGKLLHLYGQKQNASLHVGFPCRVLSFDQETCMADVQPLILAGVDPPSMIQNVPALGQRLLINGAESVCKPALKQGDTVLVICSDRELKNALNGDIAAADSQRMHSLNDAVIVGVFPCSL
ncbi:hypothetical protein BVG16_13800 [Paenibacillus selenitireducens]|uniref:Phage protein Gp138 N-terminal domain-containing protein n=2 Tax=Paenibacillus selenitireducens TaxID=1324314 RepID=A0A1T2XD57_9BACL|nr:hypothetical protein BVG16_13800 [Paenibacillus selenitireducens]